MMKRLLRRSLVALLIWMLLVAICGGLLEVSYCGHYGCADGLDDPGMGILMMIMFMTTFVIVVTGFVLYQLVMWLRSR